MRKKIAVALAAGVAFGTMFAAPVAASVAEAASSESVLKLKSPAETFATQGDKLYAERKYAEAGEAYKKAAEEDEKNDQYWFQAGISFQNAGKPHSAADCFKKAVKLQPNNGIYNKWLGVAYWAQTSNPGGTSTDTLQERAMKYTGRAAELLPNDIDAQATAGVIEEAVGDSVRIQSRSGWFMVFPGAIERHFKKAYQYYRRAVEIDPSKTENIDRLNRFVSTHSEYGFQPYTPATQSTPQPAGTTDAPGTTGAPSGEVTNNTGNLHTLIYTPLQSENTVLAFQPLDSEGDISEIYLNPYKFGRDYIIISTFPYERGRGYYHHFSTFAYTPDDPDDPGAGGEFLFTGGDGGYLSVYFMRARIIDETTLKIEWVTGKDAPQPRQPSEYLPYPEDIYELQHLTQDQADNYRKVSYRFISKHGHFPRYYNQEFSAMFAVLDFLKEGNTLEAITEPPQGMAIPGEDEDFKQPGKYRKPKTDVAAAR